MREYIDLSLNPRKGILESMLRTAANLGYSRVGLDTSRESDYVDVVSRVEVHPRSQNDLGKQVRQQRGKVEIIVVHCNNRSISRQAANDNRIDLIRYPVSGGKRLQYLDRRQAGIMKDTGIGYEVCAKDLLVDDRLDLVKRLGVIKKSLDIALKHDLPVVLSSSAEDCYGLRDPQGLASLMTLLDIDESVALEFVSDNPKRIIEENRAKLGPNYIEPGVWLVDP